MLIFFGRFVEWSETAMLVDLLWIGAITLSVMTLLLWLREIRRD